MKRIWILTVCCLPWSGLGQEGEQYDPKALRASEELTREANKELADNDFIDAEANFRRAISKSVENPVAPYNLGNAYYNKESFGEAFGSFKEAGERAGEKPQKHKAFHNMGNVYMRQKEYAKAVEAYKEALRNDPADEETRYNLALAKELMKKDQQNQDQQNNEDNEDEQKQDEQNQDQQNQDQNEGDSQDNQEDQENQQDGDSEKEDNKEGDGDKKQEQDRKPDEKDQQQQTRPNQLSPQQIQNLLQAMENEEKKVKEQLDAQKVKGAQVKTEKDW